MNHFIQVKMSVTKPVKHYLNSNIKQKTDIKIIYSSCLFSSSKFNLYN